MGTVCTIPTRHWKISPLEDITSWGPYLDRGDGFETFFCFFFWCFTRCSIYSFFERVFNIFINIDLLALFSSSLEPPKSCFVPSMLQHFQKCELAQDFQAAHHRCLNCRSIKKCCNIKVSQNTPPFPLPLQFLHLLLYKLHSNF